MKLLPSTAHEKGSQDDHFPQAAHPGCLVHNVCGSTVQCADAIILANIREQEVKGPIPGQGQLGVVVEVEDAEIQEKLQEECVKYLTLMGFPADALVANGDSSKAGHVVVVAQSKHSALADRLESAGESIDWDALGEEGLLIRHVPLDGTHYLLIAANTKRAVQYALYYYLERVCHVGFFEDREQVPPVDVRMFFPSRV